MALAIPAALELGMENMRALFHSKGSDTGEGKGKRHLGATCTWYLLHTGLLTPDSNNTCRLCVPTHACTRVLQGSVRAGGWKPEPKSGLKPDF